LLAADYVEVHPTIACFLLHQENPNKNILYISKEKHIPNTSPTANMVAKSAEFEKAITDSRSLPKTLSNDELLEVRPVQSCMEA
jgi:hypothetical protein